MLYVENENKIKKNQIIREIYVDMTLLERKHEIILFDFTGVATSNINENIYYIVFDFDINDQ